MRSHDDCRDCGHYRLLPPATSYGWWLSLCADPAKPVRHGVPGDYVVQADGLPPGRVEPPVWCRQGVEDPGKDPSASASLSDGAKRIVLYGMTDGAGG